ncbi:MAG: hypothetical protein LBB09_01625 [Rickettsiales bacterium]|jgi:dihydroorotate dehydrogenase|nr:hypothetical protein [Rickettsiales bacterium]
MGKSWLYDENKNYDENYDNGPDFHNGDKIILPKDAGIRIFGKNFISRIVLSSGPLLNYKHVAAALDSGYTPVYKTVRTFKKECLPFPNIVFVDGAKQITVKDEEKSILVKENKDGDHKNISITNSFGMPSQASEVWMEDVKKCQEYAKKLNASVIYSFVGSGDEFDLMRDDYAKCAALLVKSGAEIIEANFSCPNVNTNNGFLYSNPELAEKVLKKIRENVGGDIILGVKVGNYDSSGDLKNFLLKNAEYLNYIAGINTVSKKVVRSDGTDGLVKRTASGICGSAINEAGMEFLKQVAEAKKELKLKNFAIISGGGVMTPEHAKERFEIGADFIGVATAAMWNRNFAKECCDYGSFRK